MRRILLVTAVSFMLITGCDRSPDNTVEIEDRNGTQAASADDRDQWQRPDALIAIMEGNVQGKTIADLFAGDGYFTFPLVAAGAKVIAMDSDPANIAALEARKKTAGLTDDQLIIRQVTPNETGLAPQEADAAVMVHGFGRISERKVYFAQLREGLREPRPLFLVEWQHRETPKGPPMAERYSSPRIMDELGSFGFHSIGAHGDKMPYQVIYSASDPYDMGDELYEVPPEASEGDPM